MFSDLLGQGGLSLDRLQSFCKVAQAGGVTRAAQGDPARQSLFSRQIKELEEFFGTELIRRKGRGIVLTDAGARLNTLARECCAALSDFKSECRNQTVEIVIGAGESIIQWLIMPHLDQLRHHLPNARLKLLNLPTTEAVKRLADGLIDFALVRKEAIVRPLQAQSLGVMDYSLFVPSNLAAGRKDWAKLIDGLPLATLEGEGAFRSSLALAAKKASVKLNIQIECSSFPLAAKAVAMSNVAAILPTIATVDFPPAVATQVPIPFLKTFVREMCLATNPRMLRVRPVLDQAATAFAQTCRFSHKTGKAQPL
ncbi:MAG TPA: LysR family transcriptional regulator [Candidatus Paceibacterota bacterium]|nr:LysR family transcriptional regulator [Verrucomicrobiota bacterium]HRY47177.1 LysR family transcriptional regulator [Candidatus Paceibacterota bacterium]HRZ99608.1 LysR family transcriptional regulator [Candidatus Paceibacterota bacterium]